MQEKNDPCMTDEQFEKLLEALISIRSWMCFIGGAICSAILVN